MKRAEGKVQDVQLPEGLALRAPRAEAVRLLREVIGRGETLARRRAPVDLRVKTSQARELVGLLRTWGNDSLGVMETCFGTTAADVVRRIGMRYTTLDAAKGAVEGRLTLLTEALTLAGQLRKAPEKRRKSARTPKPRIKTASSRHHTSPSGSQAVPGRQFDFCLSFAGENRSHAKHLNTLLDRRGARVFYDDDRKHELV